MERMWYILYAMSATTCSSSILVTVEEMTGLDEVKYFLVSLNELNWGGREKSNNRVKKRGDRRSNEEEELIQVYYKVFEVLKFQ